MRVRSVGAAPVAERGQLPVASRKRVILILSVPALSLLLPGLAVEVASAGGPGQLTSAAAAVAQFLLLYSGVFALVALSAAVAAGLIATDRIVLTPERRILAQALHRTFSLIGVSALGNHILLEILASRARIVDGFVPFLASRSTFYMGLGTLSSDLFVLVVVTGVLRRRFTRGARRALWRGLHLTAYAAWPIAVLHGLLAGRSARPYVDWSYGACLAAVALALIVRYVVLHRGRNPAPGGAAGRTAATLLAPRVPVTALAQPASWPVPREPLRPLRALPSPGSARTWADRLPRPPRWEGAPWSQPEPAGTDDQHAWTADQDGRAPDQDAWTHDYTARTAPPPDGRDQ
jgi:hypothetical protein